MLRNLKRAAALLLAAALLAFATVAEAPRIEAGVADITKNGNLTLNISDQALLSQGYEYGDVVTVTIAGQSIDMPIVSNYSDVDAGKPVCRLKQGDGATPGAVVLALNSGDLATALGIATRQTIDADPGYRWTYASAYQSGVDVAIQMKAKGGYLEEYQLRQLTFSTSRSDYPGLADAQYANFRAVTTPGMGKNALYRSSSPVDPDINRNREADAACSAGGIRTVMNMADSAETMKGYEGYAYTYYSGLDIAALNLNTVFGSDSFRSGMAKGLRFIIAHEGPFLIHCKYGKDRTGFACAMLECLMGASLDEVVADYMTSCYNYYGVQPGTKQYEIIASSNIVRSLSAAFGVENLHSADLSACAETWLSDIGLTGDEISALRTALGTDI